jgi:hypothetical protein
MSLSKDKTYLAHFMALVYKIIDDPPPTAERHHASDIANRMPQRNWVILQAREGAPLEPKPGSGLVRKLRSIGTSALVLLLAFLAFEAGAQFLYWLEMGKLFLGSRGPSATQVVGTSDITAKIHPYFGWMVTYSPDYNARNNRLVQNLNFTQIASYVSNFDGCCDVPMPPEEHQDKFIVVIMGNSVAEGLAHNMQLSPQFQEKLSHLPKAKGKRVLILSFAHGGHHQPQYLSILEYLLTTGTKLDLVVYFASVQDTLSTVFNEESGLAPEYPTIGVWQGLTRNIERVADASFGSLAQLWLLQVRQATQRRLDQCRTASCLVVLRPILKLQTFLSGGLETRGSAIAAPTHFITYYSLHPGSHDPSLYYNHAIASWQRATTLMATLAEAAGAEFAEVLLPSSYVLPIHRDPKAPQHRYWERAVPLLARMVRAQSDLRSAGVRASDATHLLDGFAIGDTSGYLDEHSHLGLDGARVVIDFTAHELLDSGSKITACCR